MNRRDFSLSLAALGLAAAAGPAMATRGVNRPGIEPEGRAKLYFDGDAIALNYLVVVNRAGTLGLDLRKNVPQFETSPMGARLYNDLTRPPLRRLLSKARQVGTVHFFKRTLFVLPTEGDIRRGRASVVYNERSFEPMPPLMKFNLTNMPSMATMEKTPLVGEAWQTDDRLLLLIGPSDEVELSAGR